MLRFASYNENPLRRGYCRIMQHTTEMNQQIGLVPWFEHRVHTVRVLVYSVCEHMSDTSLATVSDSSTKPDDASNIADLLGSRRVARIVDTHLSQHHRRRCLRGSCPGVRQPCVFFCMLFCVTVAVVVLAQVLCLGRCWHDGTRSCVARIARRPYCAT